MERSPIAQEQKTQKAQTLQRQILAALKDMPVKVIAHPGMGTVTIKPNGLDAADILARLTGLHALTTKNGITIF